MTTVSDAAALFAEHRERLFRYLCRAVGHTETARDLTQDVFLRVARAGAPDATDGDTRAWLFRIARNLALDHHRTQARRPSVDALAAAPGRDPKPDVAVAVNQALEQLAELDRDVFLLRETGGLSYDEIAKTCDLTPDAVRSRIHRA